MAEVTAGARIHRRDELKTRRKCRLARGTRDVNLSRLERLAQHLEHLAIPLGELVEKQHSVMRQRNLARPRIASTADERDGGRSVMRRPIRAASPILVPKAARQRLQGSRLQCLVLRHRWQQSRKPLRKHRFSGSRGAQHQQAVSARGGDLERAFRMRLAAHIDQIGSLALGTGDGAGIASRQQLAPAKVCTDFEQASRRMNDGIANERGLDSARLRQDEGAAVAMRFQGHRQRAANRPQIASQSKLAGEFVAAEGIARNLPGGGKNSQRDGQVEATRFLGQVGGREVDSYPARGKVEPRVLQGGANAIAALLDLGLGQSDQIECRQPAGKVNLDFNRRRVEPGERTAVQDGYGHAYAFSPQESLEGASGAAGLLRRGLGAGFEQCEALLERLEPLAGASEQRHLDIEFLAAHEIKPAERAAQQDAHVFFGVADRARGHRLCHARTDVVKNLFANHDRTPSISSRDESSKIRLGTGSQRGLGHKCPV
jgi:hypothetical protein